MGARTMRGAGLIGFCLILAGTAAASVWHVENDPDNPSSGEYLHALTGDVYSYDNQTETLTYVGPYTGPFVDNVCTITNLDPSGKKLDCQDGQCKYVAWNASEVWSKTSVYADQGACASFYVTSTDPVKLYWRVNIRELNGPFMWKAEARFNTGFMVTQTSDDFTDPLIVPACLTAEAVTECHWNITAPLAHTFDRPTGATRVTVDLRLWQGATDTPPHRHAHGELIF
jgi:hypothetical protein